MDVAVARVHVQGDKHAAAHGFAVDFAQRGVDFGIGLAAENIGQGLHHIGFYRHTQPEIAECDKAAFVVACFRSSLNGTAEAVFILRQGRVEMIEQPLPALPYGFDMGKGVAGAIAQQFGAGQVGVHFVHRQAA